MEVKQYVLKANGSLKKSKSKSQIPRNKWQGNHDDLKPMGCNKNSSKRKVYSNTIPPQEARNLIPKATRERRINKTQG